MSSLDGSSIDTRSIRKEAVNMLKSGQALSKTLKWSMRKSLKSEYEYEDDGSLGGAYNKTKKPSVQYNSSSRRASEEMSFIESSIQDQTNSSINANNNSVDKKTWYAFKMYSKYSSDNPSDNDQLLMPYENLDDSIQLLAEIIGTKPTKKASKKEYFIRGSPIFFHQFKRYVDYIFSVPQGYLVTRSAEGGTRPTSPFVNPIKQPPLVTSTSVASMVLTQTGIPRSPSHSAAMAATIPDISPSVVVLKGKAVPVNYLKEAIVDVFKKEKKAEHGMPSKGNNVFDIVCLIVIKLPLADCYLFKIMLIVKCYWHCHTFFQLVLSSQMNDEVSIDSKEFFGAKSLTSSLNSSSLILTGDNPRYMQPTTNHKIVLLVDPREEYGNKWRNMKAQRDERLIELERRKEREEMLYNFKRVVMNTDKTEFHRAYKDQYQQNAYLAQKNHQERSSEQKLLAANLKKQVAFKRKQQQNEAKFMRKVLDESIAKAKEQNREEISMLRSIREESGVVSHHNNSLDNCSSSIVIIPDFLTKSIKAAKSAHEYVPIIIIFLHTATTEPKVYYYVTLSWNSVCMWLRRKLKISIKVQCLVASQCMGCLERAQSAVRANLVCE